MFETKTNIKLHDTDAAGMLFFANHFRIAHTAYEAFMKSIGCGLDYIIRASDYLILIAHSEADYKRGLFLGDNLSISLKADSIGQSSFTLSYTFKNSDGNIVAEIQTVHVSVDKKTGNKIPLPDKLRIGIHSIS